MFGKSETKPRAERRREEKKERREEIRNKTKHKAAVSQWNTEIKQTGEKKSNQEIKREAEYKRDHKNQNLVWTDKEMEQMC